MTQDKTPARSAQGTAGIDARNSSDMAAQAKETARQAAGQAQAKASELTGQARDQVGTQLAGQKDRVAESLGGVAQSLRQTSQQLREQDQQGMTDYVDRAAAQVERFSGYLRENDMGQLVDDVERFARREPAMFLGGAFLLGLLGARFLKSTRPRPRYDERYHGTSGAYESQYRPYYSGYTVTSHGGYTGTTDIPAGSPGQPRTNPGQAPAGQPAQRRPGIYDKDREGS